MACHFGDNLSPKTATVAENGDSPELDCLKPCPYCRRKLFSATVWTGLETIEFIANLKPVHTGLKSLFSATICRRKQRLSQKSATVAEFSYCRRCLAVFGDSRTFLRQCGQGLTDIGH